MASLHLLLDLVALVGGTVHPMTSGTPAPATVATVLIEDGRIRAVGPELELPPGCVEVDVSGMHLIPGLIDGLAYFDLEHDLLYTAAGVTLVRDHGNDLGRIFELSNSVVRDAASGPQLSISGAVLDGFPPSTGSAIVMKDEHDVHRLLPTMLAEQVDFLSVQVNISEPAWREILKLAHEPEGPAPRRYQVWGPVPRVLTLEQVLDGGQDGVLFLDRMLPAGESFETVDLDSLAPQIERMASTGVRVTPLLSGNARMIVDPGENPAVLERLGPSFAGHWLADLQRRSAYFRDPEYIARGEVVLAVQRELLRRLHAAGVTVVPGSGAPHPWLVPGAGLHAELQQWVAAGIAPGEVLRLATSGASDALELHDRGTLQPGKIADIVVLAADPTVDLSALEKVETVVLRGEVLSRALLDERLERLVTELAEMRRQFAEPIEVAPPSVPEGAVVLQGQTRSDTLAGPIGAERWVIVREADGSVTFSGRRALRGGTGVGEVEVEVTQRVLKGKLEDFRVRVETGGHEIVVRGMKVGGQMRVERRVDGVHADVKGVRENLVAVDAGSATTAMLLAHTRKPGHFPVLRFDEALELEVVRWDLALDEDGDHIFKTPRGLVLAGFQENGALKGLVDQTGSGAITTTSVAIDDLGGGGLPLSAEKLALMRAGAGASEAAAPTLTDPTPPSDPVPPGGD
jgi:hypothetical protein